MTWFHSFGMRRIGCICDFNDPPTDRCQDDILRCNGAAQAVPSWQRIEHHFRDIDEADAKEIMGLIDGSIDAFEHPVTEGWCKVHSDRLREKQLVDDHEGSRQAAGDAWSRGGLPL